MLFKETQDPIIDRTIPRRRQRVESEEGRMSDELIRKALQAKSASEAIREDV